MKNKICYISNFYLGERRVEVQAQQKDRLLFLKTQIITLSEYKHSLSKIIFNFNLRKQDIPYINEIIALTPKQIQNTPVELNFRDNIGFSYGAWSDIFIKYKDKFDYYIFNEDDYFIHDHNFDKYLADTFNSYKDCGYLCAVAYEGGSDYPSHAANCFGISSFEVLNKIYQKYGRLLGEMDEYTQKHIGGEVHVNGQVAHTLVVIELGYKIYDIRNTYRVLHSMGHGSNHFFQLYFTWNNKHLIFPSKAKFLEDINYEEMLSPQFQPEGLNNKYI
tara:strand:- start:67 stop:891 length:825 start_codon:yes stop_codon:yes gene_type:complete